MPVPVRLQFTLRQGRFTLALDETFDARVLALYGPSGAGKTSLLEVIAGWRRPEAGDVEVGGRLLYASGRGIDVPVRRRGVGYVPQDGLLFPHLTVRGNVTYGLRGAARRGGSSLARVWAMLDLGELADRDISTLSGGERQRVAIARALAASPTILLLDEPLAAVDAPRRQRILPYIARVRDELNVPMVYVTHQAGEARALADHVLMLGEGRVVGRGPVDLLPA